MKKLFIILTACFASIGMMKAANTDISALDNIIYVDPFSAEANSQVYLSFKMKNSETIRAFQFKISLPTGVTVVNDSQVFSTDRKADSDDHTLGIAPQDDGTLLFLCGTQGLKPFKGNDGEVLRVIIDIPDGLEAGDYPIIMTEMKLNGPDGSYTTASIETTLTITGTSDGTIKLNENSTTLPVPQSGDVMVTRTISANKWNTICLPFALEEDQITDIFGDDVELAALKSRTKVGTDITIKFNSVEPSDGMEANTPYLIKISAPINNFSISGIDVEPDESKTTVSKSSKHVLFVGTLKAGTILEENQLFLNGNKFYYSTGTTTIKGFRGYFVLDEFDPSASSAPTFEIDGETTSIDEINIVDGDGRIYNLNGQHIENPTKKGVYIQNGKKVVMKK